MANSNQTKLILVDTAGENITLDGIEAGKNSVRIQAIMIVPSAATWVVDLRKADNGDVVFYATRDANTNPGTFFTFPKTLVLDGLWAETLTSITGVYLYKADRH